VHARLVDVGALTGASDNHFVCWGIEIVYLDILNPFFGFNEKVGLEVFVIFTYHLHSKWDLHCIRNH
jgi:hypothetical protein